MLDKETCDRLRLPCYPDYWERPQAQSDVTFSRGDYDQPATLNFNVAWLARMAETSDAAKRLLIRTAKREPFQAATVALDPPTALDLADVLRLAARGL